MAKTEQAARPFVQCGHMGCINEAIVRKPVDGRVLPLCLDCYELVHLNVALKWNHEQGLDTEEKRKEYAFKHQFKMKRIP